MSGRKKAGDTISPAFLCKQGGADSVDAQLFLDSVNDGFG